MFYFQLMQLDTQLIQSPAYNLEQGIHVATVIRMRKGDKLPIFSDTFFHQGR